jgi:hypothetical protein
VLVLGNRTLGLKMYIYMGRRRAEERKRGREEDGIFTLAVGPGYDRVLLLGKRTAMLWINGLYMDMVGACWWMCIGNRDGW